MYVILRSSYCWLLHYTRCLCTLYCAVYTVRYCTMPVVYVRYTPQFIRFVAVLYPLFYYVILRSSYYSLLYYTRCLCTLYSAVHTVGYCTIPVVYVRYTPQFIRFVTALYPLFMYVILRSSYGSLLHYTRCLCTLYSAVHTVRYCTIPVVYVRYTGRGEIRESYTGRAKIQEKRYVRAGLLGPSSQGHRSESERARKDKAKHSVASIAMTCCALGLYSITSTVTVNDTLRQLPQIFHGLNRSFHHQHFAALIWPWLLLGRKTSINQTKPGAILENVLSVSAHQRPCT